MSDASGIDVKLEPLDVPEPIESVYELLAQSTVRQNGLDREAQPIVSSGLLATPLDRQDDNIDNPDGHVSCGQS
jgi:hypothetical protein